MIILGIDPGTTSIGFAVVENTERNSLSLLAAGLIDLSREERAGQLKELYDKIRAVIRRWGPDAAAVERLFFAKNTKTALAVAEARGIILLTARQAGLTLYEYTPLEAKLALTGDGRADKKQVEKMVRLTLPATRELVARDDVFDAIALALTCYFKDVNPVRNPPRRRHGGSR